jgi:hypothetical protein
MRLLNKGMTMPKPTLMTHLVTTIVISTAVITNCSTAFSADSSSPGTALSAGDLRLSVDSSGEGIRLTSLSDTATKVELLAAKPVPLFGMTLREGQAGQEVRLDADAGWSQVAVALKSDKELELKWIAAKDSRLTGVQVTARATADVAASAIRWQFEVQNTNSHWGVWRVAFPQAAIADLGDGACAFVPRGPGEATPGLWKRNFQFRDTYPGAWMTMQFMAAYDLSKKTGLYIGLHDPTGSTKDLAVDTRPAEKSVVFQFDVPAENMGQPGTGYRCEGEAVWQLIRGDWFDAALIYRNWVRRQAAWYPKLGPDGRSDTVPEMRTLAAWSLGGADPWPAGGPPSAEKLAQFKEFAKRVGPPVGMHWYGWHQNPFDNDYPHYFPARDGFKQAVADLQSSGLLVMPYINGRLWDTRDRGTEDFEFSKLAKANAVKDERGQLITEEYGSKESDGSNVKFSVMCPATRFWQDRVHEITLTLFKEYGVKGVYIDQIAAMFARPCFDPSHGHPLGGGHWWADGYRKMLDDIRRDMPKDCFLTTECNAEAFVRWFDGYLTWHWQNEGQVPAFSTVYGGALQLFGRSYSGGPTRDLALRMKAGQQLTFGEQIGWLGPEVINEKSNFEFLQNVVGLRRQLQQYFASGEMARPPKIEGEVPTVKADWGWGGGNWWIKDRALLTTAWVRPTERSAATIFVNVSDQPINATVLLNAAEYGLTAEKLEGTVVTSGGPGDRFESGLELRRPISVPPHEAVAWELKPAR